MATTAQDYLESVLKSLASAKSEICAVSTLPGSPNAPHGYEKAMANPADQVCIATAHSRIEDAILEVTAALEELNSPVPR